MAGVPERVRHDQGMVQQRCARREIAWRPVQGQRGVPGRDESGTGAVHRCKNALSDLRKLAKLTGMVYNARG